MGRQWAREGTTRRVRHGMAVGAGGHDEAGAGTTRRAGATDGDDRWRSSYGFNCLGFQREYSPNAQWVRGKRDCSFSTTNQAFTVTKLQLKISVL